MSRNIIESLSRQEKGFSLLSDLLQEEYELLRKRKPQEISVLELSIHELMAQLMGERKGLIKILGGKKLTKYLNWLKTKKLPQGDANPVVVIEGMVARLTKLEQRCARQGEANTQLAFALMDQSKALLDFLHDQIAPKQQGGYSRRGKYQQSIQRSSLLKGRL